MDNYINAGGQNSQQIGRNSVNQPSVAPVPEKPKISYWMIASILLFIVLVVGTGWVVLSGKNKISSHQRETINVPTQQTVITGVMRTSGLSNEEKQKFGLTAVDYQVTDFGNSQKDYEANQVMGYFLLSNEVSDELLGKCVRVTGTIPEGWKNNNETGMYGRSVLDVVNINRVNNSSCNPYTPARPTIDDVQGSLTLKGTAVHAERPAPDIRYDYQIMLSEPFLDESNATGSPQKLSILDITPTSNKLWYELENNIGKEVTIEGYMAWGYAESRYLQLTRIEEGGVSEKTEVKNLVTRFENYIQGKNVQGLMSLYTPAKTSEEISSYRNLMGQDPDIGTPRLFHNVSSNFIVTSWKIARNEYPDNQEIIKKDGDKYIVVVEETRKSWCNAGPCAGTYSFENTGFYVLEIAKQGSSWAVDKYYLQSASPKTVVTKYGGLNF